MSQSPPAAFPESLKPKQPYQRAVGPRLRRLLHVIFFLLALLGANSVYLVSVTFLEWWQDRTIQNYFYQYMFLAHLVLGLLFITPFVVFGTLHMLAAKNRRNRRAVRVGYALFGCSLVVLITGLLLLQIEGFIELKQPTTRQVIYWMHILFPLGACWLYWLHRLTGPRVKWRLGLSYALAVTLIVGAMIGLHSRDPRQWYAVGPASGAKYFEPSLARTVTGQFISAQNLMNDDYCRECHADVHAGWLQSAHRFSSFNNPAYLASVMETREVALKRDGSVQASRWCAGCHDLVPFFSGAFDDPNFDVINHPTSQAGITCTSCHAITNVNSTRGNADFTIEEPLHYPFTFSENAMLRWINSQLVKAKPEFHKKTFLKPFHKEAEFCSTCHKVHLPKELNHYKEFLRGQDHYTPYLLSGVSGHGARSFYYPPKAKSNCSQCHMPLQESDDFAAKYFDDAQELSVHDHLFPSANTAVGWFLNSPETIQSHQNFLAGTMRVELFGIREKGEIDGKLVAPLRPTVPVLQPGETYLLETVIRTLKLGHLFTQGTVDSNEVWLDVTVTSGDRVIGRSGAMDPAQGNEVDRWSHFVNVFMLDKDGNRINRRNAQDIFTPLYNHQIPPGAGQTVHYELAIPGDVNAPVTVEVKLQYRKFDTEYMRIVADSVRKLGVPLRDDKPGEPYENKLPVTTLCTDRFTFPIEGLPTESSASLDDQPIAGPPDFPLWQRWNDYGIGLLLKGKAELRQAEEAFLQVERLGRYDGPLNLARVYLAEGRLDEAVDALNRAKQFEQTDGFPWWTWSWLAGDAARQQGHLEQAEQHLRAVLEDRTQSMVERGFDFSLDIEVINMHAQVLFELGRQWARVAENTSNDAPATGSPSANEAEQQSKEYFRKAVTQFEKTLQVDSEDVTAHYNLGQLYQELGDTDKAAEHGKLHAKYKPDDNAQGRAVRLARERYPAANAAAEAVVIYSLSRAIATPQSAVERAEPTSLNTTSQHERTHSPQSESSL
jgi:tetratricopeptide (TPR) repeat protein